ncbi:hypothetical protein SAMN05421734_11019 [Pelagirhabdus alkalitolerans]|uniref:Uncharacterized protein n=1 Tax=Pelagirhabdus alkalitolerans TaxID=1612202 RepID=A0A1G6M391_9BACI|nr:hypothetical protein [Pelagirhabdus alkalitolerans]SDC49983.1 hypothetical protein SAMN05421734_11019 [Pelagirhabdus alkalitolerans]
MNKTLMIVFILLLSTVVTVTVSADEDLTDGEAIYKALEDGSLQDDELTEEMVEAKEDYIAEKEANKDRITDSWGYEHVVEGYANLFISRQDHRGYENAATPDGVASEDDIRGYFEGDSDNYIYNIRGHVSAAGAQNGDVYVYYSHTRNKDIAVHLEIDNTKSEQPIDEDSSDDTDSSNEESTSDSQTDTSDNTSAEQSSSSTENQIVRIQHRMSLPQMILKHQNHLPNHQVIIKKKMLT